VIKVPLLVVSGSTRRRGVGKLLVEEVQSIASAENAALIELVATKENDIARAFYRSLGFVETDYIALEFVGNVQSSPMVTLLLRVFLGQLVLRTLCQSRPHTPRTCPSRCCKNRVKARRVLVNYLQNVPL
jgi:Acetyltransferase (GNAT) domain